MSVRFVLLLAALVMGATAATAQTPPQDQRLKSPCQEALSERLQTLEGRQRGLERDIAAKKAALEDQDKKGTLSAAKKKELTESLEKVEEELLDVLFRMECVRTAQPLPASPRSARSATPPPEVVEVTTYYATNRKRSNSNEPMLVYTTELADGLHYGRAVVSIPLTHKPGSIELPSIWKLERQADPKKHFVLKSVSPLNMDEARREMAQKLPTLSSKSLLIFVHGYNMSFAEAAMRTAQLAHDLKFPGLAFFYTWPSASRARAYIKDEEAARASEPGFAQAIEDLVQLPVDDIYIVAHSMGSRVVSHGLERRALSGKSMSKLRELLLAAPDINETIFTTQIAPKLATMKQTRTTLYASSADIALKASTWMHGFRRLGETTGGNVFTYPPFETVDASSASLVTRSYGHSYVMDSPSVMKDITTIIQRKLPAKLRGLNEAGVSPKTYWLLPSTPSSP
jgi:esterase/lipase superfamily enzyme